MTDKYGDGRRAVAAAIAGSGYVQDTARRRLGGRPGCQSSVLSNSID
jgi:hypothetical protein